MKLFVEINTVSKQSTTPIEGTGNWGVRLDEWALCSWECPMLGQGGQSSVPESFGQVMALYTQKAVDDGALDPSDGPDEILWRVGDQYFLATITVE